MSDPHYVRGCMLLEQGRPDLAIESFRSSLSINPEDPDTHALLGLAHQVNEQWKEALHHAGEALARNPELPLPHYVLSQVHLERRRLGEAWASITEALRLDPEDPDYLAQAAAIRYNQSNHKEALLLAEQGLRYDPTHGGCNNLRAVAQRALGQHDAEGETLAAALRRNPESPNTHANMGWSHLNAGKPHDAMLSFREALRLDPTNDWARSGIVHALKARNPVYRVILAALLKMSHLSPRTQWGIILGAWIGIQIVRGVQRSNPELSPWLQPLVAAYMVFAFLSWTATSLFNVTLLASPFGRFVLNTHEKIFACLHAACLTLGGGLAIYGAVIGNSAFAWAGVGAVVLMIPIGAASHARSPTGKAVIYAMVSGIALLGAFALFRLLQGQEQSSAGSLYLISTIVFTWLGNIILGLIER